MVKWNILTGFANNLDTAKKLLILAFLAGVVFAFPPLGLIGAIGWAGITVFELIKKNKK